MGKIEHFEIAFDSPLGTFYVGSVVSGVVNLTLNESMNIKGVFIQFKGVAEVHWTERERHYDHSRREHRNKTVHHKDSDIFFDVKLPVADRRESLASGQHKFPFSFALPTALPASFEGSYGFVRYVCLCNISRPWRFDPKCKRAFTVVSVVDLNAMPNAAVSACISGSKTLGFCCWQSGSIEADIVVNKSGFVPGESIYINAEVNNSSEKRIGRTVVTLRSVITYRTMTAQKQVNKDVCCLTRGVIAPFSVDHWSNVQMTIPPLPPTGLGGCRLIHVEYYVHFTVEPSTIFSSNLELKVPVFLGTIPLRNDFQAFAAASGSGQQQQFQPPPQYFDGYHNGGFDQSIPSAPMYEPQPGMEAYPDLPPPSYEECVYGRVNIKGEDDEHTSGQLDYAPRYVYYRQS